MSQKIAFITGGNRGLGFQTALELKQIGARVVIGARDLKQGEEAVQKLRAAGVDAEVLQFDITKAPDVQVAYDYFNSRYGHLDILVNNAGIGLVGDVASTSEEDFERVMRVNVHSVFLVTRAMLPLLLESHGSIVNIGSVAGSVGVKKRFAYCASKGAVLAMTRQIAVDYPTEIRCNCIAPGTVQTPFVEGYLEKYHAHEKDKVRAELVARQPSGRLGAPEDVAGLVRYLCSREAEFINGAVLPIDGGWTAA
jgi:NAD(P)-dependent dehydrogenase (short-subunit alcohol dehydrogenase family)